MIAAAHRLPLDADACPDWPSPAAPRLACRAKPCPAVPCRATPCLPRLARPRPARPRLPRCRLRSPASGKSPSLARLSPIVWMSPQITAHSRRSGNVFPLCLGTALRLLGILPSPSTSTRKRGPDSGGTLRPPVRIACVPCSAFFTGRPLSCAPSCEGAKAGLSRLSPQPAAAGLHPMSLAGGSPMMTRMVGAAFARHRLGRSSRGLSTCVPPIIREFVPAYALPAIRSRAHPLRACGRSCGAGGDPGIRCFFIFHEAGPSTCYGLKCLACSPPPFAWTQLAHHHCALPTRKATDWPVRYRMRTSGLLPHSGTDA